MPIDFPKKDQHGEKYGKVLKGKSVLNDYDEKNTQKKISIRLEGLDV